MKVALAGRDLDLIRGRLAAFGLEEVRSQPEVVITHGGDGTLIGAERDFPGVPKLPVRNSRLCRVCPEHGADKILELLRGGRLAPHYEPKIEARVEGRVKLALNEVGVQLLNPASAVRFLLYVNGEPYLPHEIIGDGMLVATPFGSTAYFRSVTRGSFRSGVGLAIINSVEPVEWAVLEPHAKIRVEITRGPAIVIADNDPDQWKLERGTTVEIQLAAESAAILGIDALRCKVCQPHPPREP